MLKIVNFYASVKYYFYVFVCGIVIINIQSWRKSLIKWAHKRIIAEPLQVLHLEMNTFTYY